MKEEVIAGRYAEAIFNLGKKEDKLETIKENLDIILNLFTQFPDFQKLYFHPVVKAVDKKNTLEKLLSDVVVAHVLNFMKLLVDKKREKFFLRIVKHYNLLLDKHFKRSTAKITTAVPLDEQTASMLRERLQNYLNQEIFPEFNVDSSILGGVLVKVGDRMIDATLAGQLEKLAHSIG